ncbi:MAG: hypothetical protein IPG64_07270 [Haliea sp.]|nr:hypothetical protein [Haliea sp.]
MGLVPRSTVPRGEQNPRACRAGSSTFHGTGANPGWLGDLVPLTMSALSGRIDQILIREISNFKHYPSPQIVLDTMGFGVAGGSVAARG